MTMPDQSINWKKVIDSLKKGVVVIDTDGIIRHVNPSMMDLTGYGAEELIGKTCAIFECSGCEPWFGRGGFWCMLFSSGKSMKPVSCQIDCKSGHRLKVLKQATVLRDAKRIPFAAVETFAPTPF
jgi:two-component system response regulator HydG